MFFLKHLSLRRMAKIFWCCNYTNKINQDKKIYTDNKNYNETIFTRCMQACILCQRLGLEIQCGCAHAGPRRRTHALVCYVDEFSSEHLLKKPAISTIFSFISFLPIYFPLFSLSISPLPLFLLTMFFFGLEDRNTSSNFFIGGLGTSEADQLLARPSSPLGLLVP